MERNRKLRLGFIAISIASMLLASCNNNKKDVEEEKYHEDKTFTKISSNLVENGHSDYKIVLPSDYISEESLASKELVEFIEESSGVTLDVVLDSTIDANFNGKYIALGDTTFVSLADISLNKDELGESGYFLKTMQNTIIIAGYQETNFYGTLYGVYDFLKYTIAFEVYAGDEIYYEYKDTINLFDFNEKYRPSFDLRAIEYRAVNADLTYQRRLRYIKNSTYWCSYTHTLVSTFLPYSQYGQTHPEYYGTTGGEQLCYGCGGVEDALVEAVEARLAKYPDTEYCMLGQEDNWTTCKCEKCEALMNKFGNLGGVELDFTNRIAKKVDVWLHENYPNRKVTYVFFAYNSSIEAPVNVDSKSGSKSKMTTNIDVYENTGVMLAPVGMDFGSDLYSDANEATTKQMDNWAWLFNNQNMFVWSYCIQSRSNFFHLPNFGIQREFYKYYHNKGAKMLYDQGCYTMNTPALQAMRTYISAKMMWDVTYDYYDLAYDFLNHYYDLGGKYMIDYLNFLVAYYEQLKVKQSVNGRIFMMLDDAQYWPMSTVQSLIDILDNAIKAIEPLKETNYKRWQAIYDRICIEKCSPLYMMCNFYLSSLSEETKTEYLDLLEYYTNLFEIKGTQEGDFSVSGLIETWREA